MPGLLVTACLLLCAVGLAAGERHRTPAEIELRRAEIAAQLIVLAEEEAALSHQLAAVHDAMDSERTAERRRLDESSLRIEIRLEDIVEARNRLSVETRELANIVTRTPTGPVARTEPRGLRPAQVGGSQDQVSAGTAFNPAITVIPDGLYYYDYSGGRAGEMLRGAEGFGTHGAEGEHDGIPRGFSLREVEVAFSGAVDPYFDVWTIFGVGDGAIEAEEVYIQTRSFLPGIQVRFGRFLSGIGYLNRQHRHQWDFVDQALPYEVIFGHHLGEVGVQVTWLPDLPVYLQMGVEMLQGGNSLIANQLTEEHADLLEETPGPRLFTGFLKASPDLGFSHTLQAGLSVGRSRSHQEADSTDGLPADVFDGSAWFVGTDWIWRYDSARPYGEGDLSIQGEYIYRSKTLDPVRLSTVQETTSTQDGLYAQVVYGVGPRWTAGGRFEAIGLRNQVETLAGTADLDTATRYAANITFNPTEFSRLRVQYSYGRVPSAELTRIHQLHVQWQMSLGVHGAHPF